MSHLPSTLVFSEEHMNYIFNYLNEMYSDRLNNLEKLVSNNSQSLNSLKNEIESLNESLKSIFLVNNYKINNNNSISSNFSDFFQNFIQFSSNQPLKITSKSVENGHKTPTSLKPALKSPKIVPQNPKVMSDEAVKKPHENNNKKVPKEGFKLVSPKITKKPHEKIVQQPTAKKETSTKTTPTAVSKTTPRQNNTERSKTPLNKAKITTLTKEPKEKIEINDQKKAKNTRNYNTNNDSQKIKKEILDFKKLLVKKPARPEKNESIDSKRKEKQQSTSRSVSKEKNYQKTTRSSINKTKPSNDNSQGSANYTSLIKSVNEFLNFPELEAEKNQKKQSQTPLSQTGNKIFGNKTPNTGNSKKKEEKHPFEVPISPMKETSIIAELEKHCDNINKLYDEAVQGGQNSKDNEISFAAKLSNNTSLGKIAEKPDSMERSNDVQDYRKIKEDYAIKVSQSSENQMKNVSETVFRERTESIIRETETSQSHFDETLRNEENEHKIDESINNYKSTKRDDLVEEEENKIERETPNREESENEKGEGKNQFSESNLDGEEKSLNEIEKKEKNEVNSEKNEEILPDNEELLQENEELLPDNQELLQENEELLPEKKEESQQNNKDLDDEEIQKNENNNEKDMSLNENLDERGNDNNNNDEEIDKFLQEEMKMNEGVEEDDDVL